MSEYSSLYGKLFLDETPFIDVRSEGEFWGGHFPNSTNFPLMNNVERDLVGKKYKIDGQEEAIKLGHALVWGQLKEERVETWLQQIKNHPESWLYCFRGGLRSEISQQWIREKGVQIEKVPGGYKALRNFLLEEGIKVSAQIPLYVLSARTGTGKTKFLRNYSDLPSIDLEALAMHRGSSFGYMGKQPAQITFENTLAIALMKKVQAPYLILEDESRRIGNLQLPDYLFTLMATAQTVEMTAPLENRIQWIIDEYVALPLNKDPAELVRDNLSASLMRLEKKLGGLLARELKLLISAAFQGSQDNAELYSKHHDWVKILLLQYYDPLYDYSLKHHRGKILFSGNEDECREFFSSKRN